MKELYNNRKVLCLSGEDVKNFLQDLITNHIAKAEDKLIYAALLAPQGKFLFDFFIFIKGDGIFLDCAADQAEALSQRLMMYRLRRSVHISTTDLHVTCGVGTGPDCAMADPRHPAMGWRYYGEAIDAETMDWTAQRIRLGIPETGYELLADSYILEMRFEALNGVDFRKGCYIGQEITARMKHKTQLRKGLARATLSKKVPLHTPITAEGKEIGFVCSQTAGQALIYLRFGKASGTLSAGNAMLSNVSTSFAI